MLDYLVVDVVLLFPHLETEKIISLVEHFADGPTKLNSVDCLPHISLAMGVLDKNKLEIAKQVIDELAKGVKDIPISIQKSNITQLSNQKILTELTVDRSLGLWKLHGDVMEAFKDLLTHNNVRLDYFLSPPKVSTQTIHWVQNYFEHHKTIDEYSPHVTLGEGILEKLPEPIRFSGSSLALCHLGTYCTCRKILFQT